jgi:hypothetical protein
LRPICPVLGREADEEVPEELVAAGPVILVLALAEEGAQLRLGDLDPREAHDLEEVEVLELEGRADALEDLVVREAGALRRPSLALRGLLPPSPPADHEAGKVAGLFLPLEDAFQLRSLDLAARQPEELDQLQVRDIQGIA